MLNLPHQSPLPVDELLVTPSFEKLLASHKATIVEHLRKTDPELAAQVEETLNNPAELLTKDIEAKTVILQNFYRQVNDKALQMFGMYARHDKLVDMIVSKLGVVRQVITPAKPDATPPVAAVMESNDSLLTRYYLAMHALPSTGTNLGYRYHALTLGAKPVMSVSTPEPGRVVVEYKYQENSFSGQTKDAVAFRVSPGAVDVHILAHAGNGTPSAELIQATEAYLTQKHIGQETDNLTVKAAEIKNWSLKAVLVSGPGADTAIRLNEAVNAAKEYAKKQHVLGGRIEISQLHKVLLENSGGLYVEITEPSASVRCEKQEAPYLDFENISITTRTE